MSAPQREPPTNVASLLARIRNVAQEREQQERRIQRAIASTVVGQMLPDGVVKGGTAMKIRVGEAGSRYTPDFDASRSRNVTVDDYVEQLRDRLERGWSGFTGTVRVLEPRQVEDVPADYVMQPFEIRLAYQGRHWLTVEFELGHDEVGSTEDRDLRIAGDILEIFATIGLEEPAPIPLMLVEHQIAQKLHACTYVNPKTNRNDRAHDLVDIQILEQEETIDYAELREIGTRLFAARRAQEWPPTIVEYDKWDTIYAEAAEGLDVLRTVAEAVAWANDLIARAG
jgi:Nucleotidyl transferase AbiEii toxin, Type IV TA system